MGKTELSTLKADLKAGTPARCYIFHGEEAYLREYYTRQLRELACSGPAGDFNYHKLDTRGLTVRQVSDAIEAVPLMGGISLVELDDFDLYKAGEREQWVELLNSLPEGSTLLLVYDTVAWKPDRRIKKLTEALDRHTQVVEFEKQGTRQLITWVRRRLRALNKEIDDATAEYLIFRVGGGMTALASESDKLASYASGRAVTRRDVDAVTEPVLEAQVFSIVDALTARKTADALRMLQDLLTLQEEPIAILAAMGGQLRRLYAARVLRSDGGARALQELYKLSSYPARSTAETAARLSLRWCARAVELCEQTDYRMKTSYDDPGRLLELLLLTLAAEVAA